VARRKEQIVGRDDLDDHRGMRVHYHLADRVVWPRSFSGIDGEVSEKVQHRRDVRRVDAVLRLLHAQDTTNIRVLEEHAQG